MRIPLTPALAIAAFLAIAPLPSLAQDKRPMGMAPAIVGSTWTAVEINGTAVPNDRSTFKITEEMKAAGNGGCNGWFAPVVLEGDTIHLGPIASTRKACRDTMQQEIDYFAALAAATNWEAVEGELRFLDADRNVVLRFSI